ncbi:MAG: hypothetical protein R2729_14965 [Bryobacteraceae bacterium]
MLTRRTFVALWVPAATLPAADDAAPSREMMLTGLDRPPGAVIPLRAGNVECLFEPDTAFLRYIRVGDVELLRGLYAAVRDQTWGTVTPKVSNVALDTRADSFRLTFDVECVQDDIDFPWKGTITGSPDGTVRFEFAGRARATFLKNRLGFAVLHPIKECAGKKCVIEKTSGFKEEGRFPSEISPHQPFLDLRSISHQAGENVNVEVRFEGENFEMEDHRNWTDNNYKTYCTPLERPFPVEVQRGQEIRQAVTVRLKAPQPAFVPAPRAVVEIKVAPHVMTTLPSIGLGVARDAAPLNAHQAKRLAAAGVRHLRVDLAPSEPDWRQRFDRAAADARAVGVPLEVALHLTDAAASELEKAASLAAKVARWIVFHRSEPSTSSKWTQLARKHLHGAPVGGGANQFFTELNRGRPDPAAIDFAAYSINPQVHAFDNVSLVENLEGQAATVRTAHSFLGGKPVAVTPVTLRPRTAAEPADLRQGSLFAAAWTLGSLKYLAEGGVDSVTYYQTHGPEGVLDGERVFPLFHAIAAVAPQAGARIYRVDSSEPLHSCAMAIESRGRKRLLVANLTRESRVVTVDAAWVGRRVLRTSLDEQSFADATKSPEVFQSTAGAAMDALNGRYRLAMLPYSIVRLDAARRPA